MEQICNFFNSNFFQTVAVFLGAIIAYIVYLRQKKDGIYNISSLIKLEIDSIEENVKVLMEKTGYEQIFQTTPIYQKLDWFQYRGVIVSKVNLKHIESINQFYSQIIRIEEARLALKNCVLINRESKVIAIQNDISRLLLDILNEITSSASITQSPQVPSVDPSVLSNVLDDQTKTLQAKITMKLNNFRNIYSAGINSVDHMPDGINQFFHNARAQYKNISNTPAYEELRKLSNKK